MTWSPRNRSEDGEDEDDDENSDCSDEKKNNNNNNNNNKGNILLRLFFLGGGGSNGEHVSFWSERSPLTEMVSVSKTGWMCPGHPLVEKRDLALFFFNRGWEGVGGRDGRQPGVVLTTSPPLPLVFPAGQGEYGH